MKFDQNFAKVDFLSNRTVSIKWMLLEDGVIQS